MKNILIILNIIILFSGCTLNNQSLENKIDKEKELEKQNKLLNKEIKKLKQLSDEKEKVDKEFEPKVIIKEKTKIVVVEKPITKDSKIIVGAEEQIYIPLLGITLKARIDTGATTTSLHALDIKEFERDGEKWVKFKFENSKGELTDWSLPIQRVISIKRHGVEKNQRRYVVKMRINMGKINQLVDVSLTNRDKFSFPVLIGRNLLNGYFVVDVSKKFITKPSKK